MKIKIEIFSGENPIKDASLYRLDNGCLVIVLITYEKWPNIDDGNTTCGDEESLDVYFRNIEEKVTSVLTVIPERVEEKELFRDAYFTKILNKNTIMYYVVPKIPGHLEPEQLKFKIKKRKK